MDVSHYVKKIQNFSKIFLTPSIILAYAVLMKDYIGQDNDMAKAGVDEKEEVMTLAEVAKYLQLAEKTILRMAQKGQIPAAKVASQWRFLRSVIRDWLAGQMQTVPSPVIGHLEKSKQDFFPLNEIIRPELIKTDIKPGPKETILKQLMVPLRESGFAKKPEMFLQKIVERERMMTTAIGHGIAIPHPRKPIANMFSEPAVIVGICPDGTNFEAIDDQLVHLFFVICATRDEVHLHLMAKIGLLSRDDEILGKLKQATSKEQVIKLIKRVAE